LWELRAQGLSLNPCGELLHNQRLQAHQAANNRWWPNRPMAGGVRSVGRLIFLHPFNNSPASPVSRTEFVEMTFQMFHHLPLGFLEETQTVAVAR
jgi:hypothetical protein